MNAIRRPEKKRAKVPSILAALLLCALTVFSFVMLRESAYRSESTLLKANSEKIASQVVTRLQRMLSIGERFKMMLLSDAGKDYASMGAIAEESIASIPYIDSITIAPGAIVRYSFPEERGSSSIGHDLLDNPERMRALVEAVRKKQAVLQGPSVSAEGKNLAFLRIPVLDKAELWGFVSIGFDADKLLSEFDLSSGFPGLSVALVSSGTDDRGTRIFWGDRRALDGYAAPVKDFPWTVYTASTYPMVRVVWWGFGMLALNLVSLGLFVLGTVQRQRKPLQEAQKRGGVGFEEGTAEARAKAVGVEERISEGREKTVSVEEDRTVSPEKMARSEAPFVVNPFVPESGIKEPLPGVSEQEPAVQESEPGVEKTVDEEASTTESPAMVPATVVPGPAEAQKTAVEGPEASVSVLVVDDSEVNRELLLRMLALKGYNAQAVSSGPHALEVLKERRFDLLLIDCIMPEMDGYALASAVRASGIDRPSPLADLFGQDHGSIHGRPALLAMSPRHGPEEVKRCNDAGFDALLIKPFTMTSLDQKIRETLRRGI